MTACVVSRAEPTVIMKVRGECHEQIAQGTEGLTLGAGHSKPNKLVVLCHDPVSEVTKTAQCLLQDEEVSHHDGEGDCPPCTHTPCWGHLH